MHQAQVQEWGQAPKFIEVDEPALGVDEVRITVLATGVHQVVRSRAAGKHYSSGKLPHVPGVDGVGETDDGQMVYWFSMERGTMADRVNIPKRNIRPLPEGPDPVQAAGIINPALSSWMAFKTRTKDLPAHFTVLIVGATSASGRVAISLARALGAKRVIGAGRNKTIMETLGLDGTVVIADKPEETDWSALGDVDVILDYVYGPVTAHLLASLKSRRATQYVHIGALSGQDLLLPGAVLRSKNLTIRGSGPGAWAMHEMAQSIDELLALVKGIPEQPIKLAKLEDIEAFSPRSCQRFLSYIVGWISVLGWQTGLASIAFIAGTLIQGLIVLNNPDYIFQRWHGTLLIIAIVAFAVLFNTVFAKHLPVIEGLVLILHLLGFFGVIIPLWVLSPRNTAGTVFTQFDNLRGWPTQGVSFMVGLLTSVYGLLGADSAVHSKSHGVFIIGGMPPLVVDQAYHVVVSEEIRDASIVLPRATMWSIVVNGAFGWVMVITFAFIAGNPLDIVDSQTGYPFIDAFYNATGSKVGTSVMVGIMIVNTTSSVISTLATVKPGWNIPLNAVLVTFCCTALLSLINIGSTAAFNAVSSMGTNALLTTYIISIGCVVVRRLRSLPLPARRWSLGRAGLFVNLIALAFLLWIWVFLFFPQTTPVTLSTMNWNVLINGGVMILAFAYYYLHGKREYTGPVALVKDNT
ncbi:hypothetical protein B0A55_06567 [Friedmanniomyces simplex]|uniref:Enoyl reductase (ER) domain-containing protein n=1 Tax=Friedmanniomyces simplex TaxID=329884 RepID=A0A4U0X126_9PEZI|nr:hypothetical protein B0A55_06567 [Friedmanniomyces simplex]